MASPSQHSYRADIDGLRAIAVLVVVAFHAFPKVFSGGYVGVDVFFVISGFLITGLLLTSLEAQRFSLADFYVRRIKRIFPSLILTVSLCYLGGWLLLFPDEFERLGKHIAASAVFISNIVLARESGYFDTVAESKPLLHLWSLAIEEQFYIVWPLLLGAAHKFKAKLLPLVVTFTVLSLGFNLWQVQRNPVSAFYWLGARFWELSVGGGLACLRFYSKDNYDQWSARVRAWGTPLACLLMAVAIFVFSKQSAYPGWRALWPVIASALVILSEDSRMNKTWLSSKTLVRIGLISYPLYLVHWPLLSFAHIIESGTPSVWIRIVLVGASFGLAWVFYRFFETPIRSHVHSRTKATVLFFGMSCCGAVGFVTLRADGFGFRKSQQLAALNQFESYHVPTTAKCKAAHPEAHDNDCYESDTTFNETLLVIGDSHAQAAAQGLIEASRDGRLKKNLLVIARGGCQPFMNVESFDGQGATNECRAFMTGVIQAASRNPTITTVMLIGLHAPRFEGTGFGAIDDDYLIAPWHYTYDDGERQESTNARTFEAGLRATLSALVSKKVIFVHQIPELGFDPRRCVSRASSKEILGECQVPLAAVQKRQRGYREAVARVSKEFPALKTFDPVPLFCDTTTCSAATPDEMLYRDTNHLGHLGVSKLVEGLLGADHS